MVRPDEWRRYNATILVEVPLLNGAPQLGRGIHHSDFLLTPNCCGCGGLGAQEDYEANLVVLRGDPTADFGSVWRITRRMKGQNPVLVRDVIE
jgi:hypothetical protein